MSAASSETVRKDCSPHAPREDQHHAERDAYFCSGSRPGASVSRAWLRALELTASMPRQRERVLPAVVDELGHSCVLVEWEIEWLAFHKHIA